MSEVENKQPTEQPAAEDTGSVKDNSWNNSTSRKRVAENEAARKRGEHPMPHTGH